MTRRSALLIAVGVLVFVSASSVAVFYAHRTFTTTGQRAVGVMNPEERAALDGLSKISRAMSTEQVYRALGPPSEDLYLVAKWNRFGGSALSQARIYFVNERPMKIRWIKLGFFVYERDL